MDKFNQLCKVLAEKQFYECEQYLADNNIKIRNEDGTYKDAYNVLKECAEVFNKENDNGI